MKASTSRRVVPAAAPSTGTRPAARDRLGRRIAKRLARRGRQRRPAVLRHRRHGVDRYYRRRDRAFARTNVAGNHRANARRAADQPVWRRQRRQDQRRPPRLRRFRDLKYPGAHQRPKAQRHRHGRRRFFDHSAQFDRAHRNHARQQRRGAVRRQRDRRRHQYRPEERRRRPTGCHARGGRCRLLQSATCESLGRDQLRTVVDVVLRQRHQVRRLSRKQRARPAQRGRQSQLHHARPQGLPDGDRRRPEARLPRRPHRRSLAWASTNWSRTAGAPPRRSITATSRAPAPPPASPRRS